MLPSGQTRRSCERYSGWVPLRHSMNRARALATSSPCSRLRYSWKLPENAPVGRPSRREASPYHCTRSVTVSQTQVTMPSVSCARRNCSRLSRTREPRSNVCAPRRLLREMACRRLPLVFAATLPPLGCRGYGATKERRPADARRVQHVERLLDARLHSGAGSGARRALDLEALAGEANRADGAAAALEAVRFARERRGIADAGVAVHALESAARVGSEALEHRAQEGAARVGGDVRELANHLEVEQLAVAHQVDHGVSRARAWRARRGTPRPPPAGWRRKGCRRAAR